MATVRLVRVVAGVMLGIVMIGIVFVVAVLLFQSPFVESADRNAPFSSAHWQDEALKGSPKYMRLRMVDDLLENHVLVGLRTSDVLNLLGPVHADESISICDMAYWLGPERGLISIDSEWLCLSLENDTVVSATLVTD